MNLPPVPSNLTAKANAKSNSISYYNQALDFYNKCLKKIDKGDYACHEKGDYTICLNSEDIPKKVLTAVKKQLENAGYKVDYDNCYDLFIIHNPFFNKTEL